MRHTKSIVFAMMCLGLWTSAAQAQDKPVEISLGGGWTVPNSEVKDHLGNGYNFNFGVQVNVNPIIGIEGLYSFNGLGEKRISIPVTPGPVAGGEVPTDFFANMNMQYGTGSVIIRAPEGKVKPYGLVGMMRAAQAAIAACFAGSPALSSPTEAPMRSDNADVTVMTVCFELQKIQNTRPENKQAYRPASGGRPASEASPIPAGSR